MKVTKRIVAMTACAIMSVSSMVSVYTSATEMNCNDNGLVKVCDDYSTMALSSAHYNELKITGYPQENSYWCWVACTKTILKYLKVSPLPSQTEIYKTAKGVDKAENKQGNFTEIKKAISAYAKKEFTTSTKPSFNNISDAIRYDKIVIVRGLKENSTEGHDLVVYAFDENKDDGSYVLKIYDPDSNEGGDGTLTCEKGTNTTYTWTVGEKSKTFTATNYMYGK
jgi:hypothetical protein